MRSWRSCLFIFISVMRTGYDHLYQNRLLFNFIAWIVITPFRWRWITLNEHTFVFRYVQHLTYHTLLLSNLLYWFIFYLYQVINRLSKGSLSTDVESMKTNKFDKCIKNDMGEDMRKELKEIRVEIHNINTRHIPSNIQSKLCCLLNLIRIICLLHLFVYRVRGYTNSLTRSYMGLCQKSFKIPNE